MAEQIPLRFPPNYTASWQALLGLCEQILNYSTPLKSEHLWPLLALCKKAAMTAKAIAALASMELWSDAFVLSRSLIEIEIIVKWLMKEDSVRRIEMYTSGSESEKKRLLKKMVAGISVSAQTLSDLIDPAGLDTDPEKGGKGWSGLNIRQMSREVDMERNYDLAYWISSSLVHSSVLSLLEWNPKRDDEHELLVSFFCQHNDGLQSHLVLTATPLQVLHIFTFVERELGLGFAGNLDSAWHYAHLAVAPGKVSFVGESPDIAVGEIVLLGEDRSIVKRYSPKRPGTARKQRGKK
jgi:hypothetical protein